MLEKIVGDYKIIKELGASALGTNYLAEHKFIKKPYVLKILSQELSADPRFVARFESEIVKLAQLNHPHIVKVHNVSFADGSYFLVSDYHQGTLESLAHCKDSFKEEEVLTILQQIASALDYAQQIAHLRLNLHNILIDRSEGQLHIYLSDFGLSQSFVTVAPENIFSHSFMQRYAFLSPEQKRGEVADYKSDIYAFGALAYYLLTQKLPIGLIDPPAVQWEPLFKETLVDDKEKRAKTLVPLVEAVRTYRAHMHETAKEKSSMLQHVGVSLAANVEERVLVGSRGATHYVVEREPVIISKPSTPNIVIEGGWFQRGSNEGARDEMPRHKVCIDSFSIDIHPVTNEQFIQFLEMVGGEKDDNHDLIRLKDSRLTRSAGKLSIETGYSKHPVVGVSWYGACAYAKWLGRRLPTEVEWEIAAQGGLLGPFPTGESIEKNQTNFFSSDTTAVMSYAPNGYGLYDMAGNVYEWCQDWYGYNYYEHCTAEPHNPKGPAQGVYRVLRGGCWKSLKDDLRSSHRHRNNPGTTNSTCGFRTASEV